MKSEKEIISENYKKIGKLGGIARANSLTAERRSEIATIASHKMIENLRKKQAGEVEKL